MIEYFIIFFISLIFIILAVLQDIKGRRISNKLNLSFFLFIVAIKCTLLLFGYPEGLLYNSIIGAIALFIFGTIMHKFKALGGGDVKLFLGLGFSLPSSSVGMVYVSIFAFLFYLFVCTLLYYSIFFILARKVRVKIKELPYAPVIALSYIIFYLLFLFN